MYPVRQKYTSQPNNSVKTHKTRNLLFLPYQYVTDMAACFSSIQSHQEADLVRFLQDISYL